MNYIFKMQDLSKMKELIKLIRKFEGKSLIISFIQENRELEKELGILNEIIYDNSDYLSGTISLEYGIIEVDENLEILPSSYKQKKDEMDFSVIKEEISTFEYDNVFILIDDKLKILNLDETIIITEKDSSDKIISTNTSNKSDKIIGYLIDSELDNLKKNLLEGSLIVKKKGLLQKIKRLLKK